MDSSLTFIKALSCLIIFILNTIASLFTFLCVRKRCVSSRFPSSCSTKLLSYANCFSVGLFLSVSFLGLYNSSSTKLTFVQRQLQEANWFHHYPLSEAILCTGFFVLWCLECLMQQGFRKCDPEQRDSSRGPTERAEVFQFDSTSFEDRVNLLSEYDRSPPPTSAQSTKVPLRDGSDSFLRSIFLVWAMCLHSLLEAVGFALLDTISQVLSMAVGMALHHFLCSLTLGLRLGQLTGSLSKHRSTLALLIVYLILLPAGVAIGCSIYPTQMNPLVCKEQPNGTCSVPHHPSVPASLATGLVQNFAAATFLYVVFVDMLPGEISGLQTPSACSLHSAPPANTSFVLKESLRRCFFGFSGFLIMAITRFIGHG